MNGLDLGQASKAASLKRRVLLCLPADISDSAVREHFADCGDVVAVRIVRDRQSGMGKGFGYVLFEVCMNVRLQDTCQNRNWELLLWPYLTLAFFKYGRNVRW